MVSLNEMTLLKMRGMHSKHYCLVEHIVKLSLCRVVNCIDFLESGDVIAGDDAGAIRTYSVSLEGEYYMSSEFEAHSKGMQIFF